MDKSTLLVALIASLPGFFLGMASLWITIKKNAHEIQLTDAEADKVRAETNDIHAQIADRWAEHVNELQQQVARLREDIALIKAELIERDQIIDDLKDWAERLVIQLNRHAPTVTPARYYRRGNPMESA